MKSIPVVFFLFLFHQFFISVKSETPSEIVAKEALKAPLHLPNLNLPNNAKQGVPKNTNTNTTGTRAKPEDDKTSVNPETVIKKTLKFPTCDMAIDSTICFSNGQVILPDAQTYGLVARFSFDETEAVDSSGKKHHATGKFFPGPSFMPGSSGLFRRSYVVVPHAQDFESPDFTYTFWIMLLEDDHIKEEQETMFENKQYCPVIHKGVVDTNAKKIAATPSIAVDPKSGRVKVTLSTSATSSKQAEYITTNGRLKYRTWTHVAVTRHMTRLRVYMNGILDSTILTIGTTDSNKYPIYIGATPWTKAACDTPLLLDEFKIYSIAIGRDQIQAEASPALGGVEPSFVHISCVDCPKVMFIL